MAGHSLEPVRKREKLSVHVYIPLTHPHITHYRALEFLSKAAGLGALGLWGATGALCRVSSAIHSPGALCATRELIPVSLGRLTQEDGPGPGLVSFSVDIGQHL